MPYGSGMRWPDHAIWWQVYPLGFTGAFPPHPAADAGESTPVRTTGRGRTLTALIPWLDYVVELGCSGLLLGPIFESHTHGYDTIDYFKIDPRLGTEDDFNELVSAARRRGLRVVLDGVFNHVGRGFAPLRLAQSGGPDAAGDGADPADIADASRWFRPGFETFEGHGDLVVLNHDEPRVGNFVTEVMTHWLDRGIDGWRLDAAYAVPPAFWRPVLARVRERHPDAWFVGEMIHGEYAAYVEESTIDSVTQYELWKAIWSSLNDGNFFELAWALERHEDYAARFLPLTFVGNHDVTRIASKLDDPDHVGHALAVLFTVAGTPSIYYGDEQAFRGVKEERFGGDDAIRPEFPVSPAELAPWGLDTYRLHQELIAMRRRNPWLAHARTEVLTLTNTSLALRSTPREGVSAGAASGALGASAGVVALLNVGPEPFDFGDVAVAGAAGLAGTADADAASGWAGIGPAAMADAESGSTPTGVVPANSWGIWARG